MAKDIATYQSLINETINYIGFGTQNSKFGIVLHRIYVDGSGNASDYEPTEINGTGTQKQEQYRGREDVQKFVELVFRPSTSTRVRCPLPAPLL